MPKGKILVIEDEKDQRENICKILELEGYQTLQAENGEQGIEMARKHKPDLILCDIRMPRKSGYEVILELKKEKITAEIPFIFLTVFANKENVVRGLDLGAQDYIPKPFDNKELLARIRTQLEIKKNTERYEQAIQDLREQIGRIKLEKESLLKSLNEQKPGKGKELEIAEYKGQLKAMDKILKDLVILKNK